MNKNVAKAIGLTVAVPTALTIAANRLAKTRAEDDPPLKRELPVALATVAAGIVFGHKVREHYGVNRPTMGEDLFKN